MSAGIESQKCKMSDVFNFKSDKAKGRIVVLMTLMFNSIVANLTTGIFLTNFLLELDINIVQIGVIGFIPSVASIFSVFSPYLLAKLKKRKYACSVAKFLYYVFSIVCVNLMASTEMPSYQIYLLLLVFFFIANLSNTLIAGPGYMVWHFQFLEERVKTKYFSVQQLVATVMAAVTLLTSGVLSELVKNSGNQMQMMLILRYVAFFVGVLDCIVLALPKEFPYSKNTEEKSPIKMFFVALKYKKFLLTVLISCLWNLCVFFAQSAFDVNLLNHIQVRYSLVTVINASLFLFFVFFSKFWTNIILKRSWLPTLKLAIFCYVGTIIGLSFVTNSNYIWLYTLMRLLQNFLTVGINITITNVPYLNLGEEDQTGCLSFYSFISSIFTLSGQALGTFIISKTQEISFGMFGGIYNNVTVLLWIQSILMFGLSVYISRIYIYLKKNQGQV